jgi:predicted transcriptional regulator
MYAKEDTMIQQVSDSELELMKIIWAKGGMALYADIMNDLAAKGYTWQKNTVITLLARLVDKGLLKTSKIGRRNEYTAMFTETDYQAARTQNFVNKFYKGKAKELVLTLIQEDLLSPDDYEDLKSYWEGIRNKP